MSEPKSIEDLADSITNTWREGNFGSLEEAIIKHVNRYVSVWLDKAAERAVKYQGWDDDDYEYVAYGLRAAILGDHLVDANKKLNPLESPDSSPDDRMSDAEKIGAYYDSPHQDGRREELRGDIQAAIDRAVEEMRQQAIQNAITADQWKREYDRLATTRPEPRQTAELLGTGAQWNQALDVVRNKEAASSESKEAWRNDPLVHRLASMLKQWERETDHRARDEPRQTAGDVEALRDMVESGVKLRDRYYGNATGAHLALGDWAVKSRALLARKGANRES